MKSLAEIHSAHAGKVSDKWALYLEEYQRILEAFRNLKIRLLEIGVQNGGSLEIWSKYFESGEKFVGCDILKECGDLVFDDQRIQLVVGDITYPETFSEIAVHSNSYNIIIDDGSHHSGDIIKAFALYFPLLSKDGLYIIEDLHCSYWNEYNGGLYDPYSSMSFLKRLTDLLNHEHWGIERKRNEALKNILTRYSVSMDEGVLSQIHSIEFINSMCVIRKKSPERNVLSHRTVAGCQEMILPNQSSLNKQPYKKAMFEQIDNHWSTMITAPEEQYESLTEDLTDIRSEMTHVRENLTLLNQTITERDQQIGVLHESITQRNARIGELGGSVETLSKSLGERDQQIGVLNESINHRDTRINTMFKEMAEKENQLISLKNEIAVKESALKALSEQFNASQATVEQLTSSFRWRITQPIQFMGEIYDVLKKRLQKYALAARTYRAHRQSGVFDPVWYLESNPDVRSAGMNPWRHFLFLGIREDRAPNPNFNPNDYLRLNPDIAESSLTAVEHYMTFGWRENRAIKENSVHDNITVWVNHYRPQLVHLDRTKKTVLLVTHEISRTGAPILVLNLAEKLRKYYTVIVLSMGGGTLLEEFTKVCDLFIGPLIGEQGRHDFLCGFLKGVKELHPIDCAMVNCIVSTPILRPLWENDIPSSHLIHEFSSYTRPETTFNESAFFSAKQIFSSKLVLENALSDYPNLANKSPLILPQGRCLPPLKPQGSNDGMMERARIDSILRPPGSPENLFVVIGLGTVQLRKGVDLFLECAHKVSKMKSKVPIRFVWFGHGYNVELDGDYSVYLHDQMRRSGIEQMCAITHETDQLDHVYESANLLFLSSRLDPLPLVSQDMMAHGKPVLCFEKATGLSEFLLDEPVVRNCVIDYMDVEGAAARVVELANDEVEYQRVGNAFKDVLGKTFNLDNYADQIHEHCKELINLEISEREDREIIKESGLLDEKFFRHHAAIDQLGIKAYMSLWTSGLDHRKPFPGFHPGIYAERHQISFGDPFADYLRRAKPSGPWIQEVITPEEVTDDALKKVLVPTALHLHLYYPEMADDILARIERCKSRPDLLISVRDEVSYRKVEESLLKHGLKAKRIAIVPNRGRDIGPFLTEFGRELTDNYEIIGHIHSKKTVSIRDQDLVRDWVDFLYGNLLGNEEPMMDSILKKMGEDLSIGLVYPDDPFVMGWGDNKKNAKNLLERMKVTEEELFDNINFPVGTMFWARSKALQPLFDLKLEWGDYPEEPLPYDGSMLHAIERIIPIITVKNNFKQLLTSDTAQMR
jgi:glycosyltransferase involved in cell wall biosynthesis/predicted  nucleic acid-binding Zn-ribbon protein